MDERCVKSKDMCGVVFQRVFMNDNLRNKKTTINFNFQVLSNTKKRKRKVEFVFALNERGKMNSGFDTNNYIYLRLFRIVRLFIS